MVPIGKRYDAINRCARWRGGGDDNICKSLGFDPSAAYHTYTTLLRPDNTITEYVDGAAVAWDYVPNGGSAQTATVIGPFSTSPSGPEHLILSYALRNSADGDPDPFFMSGFRNWSIRSVSIYENTTANGANTVNGGLAPGTAVN